MTKVITLRKKRKNYLKPEKTKKKATSDMTIEKNRVLLLIMSIVFILAGALAYRFFPNADITSQINASIELFNSADWKEIFIYFLQADLIYLLISFFIGTSFAGAILSALPIILKCFLIGYQSGYMYNEYALKGVLFCLILLYPCYVITTSSLIFACDESIYMSKYLFSTITNKNTANDISVKLYLLRYLILFIINIVCIAVNSAIVWFIAPKINLL